MAHLCNIQGSLSQLVLNALCCTVQTQYWFHIFGETDSSVLFPLSPTGDKHEDCWIEATMPLV